MNDLIYEIRKNPWLSEFNEGQDGFYTESENPYNREIELERYISWECGHDSAYNFQVLIDMGR